MALWCFTWKIVPPPGAMPYRHMVWLVEGPWFHAGASSMIVARRKHLRACSHPLEHSPLQRHFGFPGAWIASPSAFHLCLPCLRAASCQPQQLHGSFTGLAGRQAGRAGPQQAWGFGAPASLHVSGRRARDRHARFSSKW